MKDVHVRIQQSCSACSEAALLCQTPSSSSGIPEMRRFLRWVLHLCWLPSKSENVNKEFLSCLLKRFFFFFLMFCFSLHKKHPGTLPFLFKVASDSISVGNAKTCCLRSVITVSMPSVPSSGSFWVFFFQFWCYSKAEHGAFAETLCGPPSPEAILKMSPH